MSKSRHVKLKKRSADQPEERYSDTVLQAIVTLDRMLGGSHFPVPIKAGGQPLPISWCRKRGSSGWISGVCSEMGVMIESWK